MNTMWAGRFQKQLNSRVNDFNSSIHFDCRMYKQDIKGSIAHATMLGKCGIISQEDAALICKTLGEILDDLDAGTLAFDMNAEDIHMFIESELTARIGDVGKRLHTARSRNDQVALDLRLYLRDEIAELKALLFDLLNVICNKSEQHAADIMPGYTHLQRAQPVTLGHYLMAYGQMFARDVRRLDDVSENMNVLPLGSCALAGTTYPIDRFMVAELLGFDSVCQNSMDGVSDRDYAIELLSTLSIVMMHLSRFSEEIILWSSSEFGFVDLDDAYSTGSSIMPQKKNPDIAELVRGKTGRVYGDLTTLLTVMKGIPLAYNKDMQEDKEAVFDALDTVKICLELFAAMLDTATFNTVILREAVSKGFINATDCADYMVKKGLPFRSAYKIVGQLVAYCIAHKKTLETLTLDEYHMASPVFEDDVYQAIDPDTCVAGRACFGGPAPESVLKQIKDMRKYLKL
ncbi:MAG: argininosuccinate lyase [Clostridia bacterium]|nr:argininosuccinate lyase [Clostridia bacterium]MBO7296863.1 argininosuccinate lyase [Clostridia bacterium]